MLSGPVYCVGDPDVGGGGTGGGDPMVGGEKRTLLSESGEPDFIALFGGEAVGG